MSARRLVGLLMVAALLGCRATAAPSASAPAPTNRRATSTPKATAAEASARPIQPDLGPRSSLPLPFLSNNSGRLTGRVTLPANLLSDRGAGIISDRGAGVISNHGGGVISNHGGGVISNHGGGLGGGAGRRLLAAEVVPVASATVVLTDAAGHWLPDADGRPYIATTDANGDYAFERTPAGLNALVLVLGLPEVAGTPTAMLPALRATAAGEARRVDVDAVSTLALGYIRARFVRGDQAVLDRLPADVEADTRRKLAAADTAGPTLDSLAAPAVVARVDALRAQDATLDAQVRYVERLLVAGLSNLGEGLPATEVTLAAPQRLAARPDGELYLVENWAGRIRRIATDGRIYHLAGGEGPGDLAQLAGGGIGDDGPAQRAVFNSPTAVALDAAGNIYVCDTGHHRIRRIEAATGRVTTVAGNRPLEGFSLSWLPPKEAAPPAPGTPAREATLTSPHAVAVDAQGRCVFASKEGTFRIEASGALTPLALGGYVRKLAASPEGQIVAARSDSIDEFVPVDFARLAGDRFEAAPEIPGLEITAPWHLAAGPAGALYALSDKGLLRLEGRAWTRVADLSGIKSPTGLTANAEHVWISSEVAGQVWRYTLASGTLTRVAGTPYDPTRAVPGAELSLNRPGALAFDAQGRLLVGDGLSGVVWRRDADGLYRRVAGNGDNPESMPAAPRGLATEQAIGLSTSLLPQPDGGLVISAVSLTKRGVYRVDAAGQLAPLPLAGGLTPFQVAPDGQGGYLVVDMVLEPLPKSRIVQVSAGQVKELVPWQPLAVHYALRPRPDGGLYYTDVLTGVVYDRAPNGTTRVVAGSPEAGPGFGGDGGPATAARLRTPMGLAFDGSGHLYVSDAHNHRVRRIDAKTGVITTLAGEGGAFFAGKGVDDGLREPTALAFDPTGTLYIADAGHSQIKQIPADKLPR